MPRRLVGIVLACTMAFVVALASSPLWARGSIWVAIAHSAFGGLCHQDPARSFVLDGAVMAICHRCTGIDVGLACGALAVSLGLRVRPRNAAAWLIVAGTMGAQVALGALVPAVDLAVLRVGTGLAFGALAGAALTEALGGSFGARARHLCPEALDRATLGAVQQDEKEIR